jgi:alkylated DNA repair dioxygenase AlkB
MKAPVIYIPNFVENPTVAFAALHTDLKWERRDDVPRYEYYSNDFPRDYIYGVGRGRRAYSPQPYHPTVMAIRAKLEKQLGHIFEVCFLNRYVDQSDSLGWHADDSADMDDARPIVTISLGVEREIWFRPKTDPEDIEKLKLAHGSCAIMAAGMQDTHQHRIPKSSRKCGERISLTFRGYVDVTP